MIEKLFNILTDLTKSIISFLKILFRSHLFTQKISAEGNSIFILGNGPSIKDTLSNHYDFLKTQKLICVNAFSNSEHFENLKPAYYLLAAPEIWSGQAQDGKYPKIRQAMVDDIIDKTNWKLTLILPFGSKKNKKFIQSIRANKNIKIHFFNNTPIEGLTNINHLFFSFGWGMPRPHNVLVPCLMQAILAGYKKIYLLGADHSWLPLLSVDDNNRALLNQQHFYDKNTSTSEPMYKLGIRPRRLHEILEKFYYSFRSYFDIQVFSKKKNVQIFNATPKSFIDAFERQPMAEIIKK